MYGLEEQLPGIQDQCLDRIRMAACEENTQVDILQPRALYRPIQSELAALRNKSLENESCEVDAEAGH